MYSDDDIAFMRQALTLAEQGLWTTSPNPRVGCVLVKSGQVVGRGFHRRAGEAHAEVLALAEAGPAARGATAYVTLEPCSHIGRTGPCAQALIQAGVASVVAAMQDPNPLVSGQGLAQLRAARIEVRCGLLAEEAEQLNIGFVHRMRHGRPWVRAKMAMSLDGRTALPNGTSQWITDATARQDGHAWRARACAVATGAGTARVDNPALTVRAVETPRQPLRVLFDAQLMLSEQAQLFDTPGLRVFTARDLNAPDLADRRAQLDAKGAVLSSLPSPVSPDQPRPRVDLSAALALLASRDQVNELHLEAGHRLTGAFLQAGLIDEWLLYLAPVWLGEGQPPISGMPELTSLHGLHRLQLLEQVAVGDGLRLRLLQHPSDRQH